MRRLLAAAGVVVATALPVLAQAVPAPPAGHIHDGADVLPPTVERTFGSLLARGDRTVFVVTVASSGRLTAAQFGQSVFGRWRPTRPTLDRSALVVVVTESRQSAILVGPEAAEQVTETERRQLLDSMLQPQVSRGQHLVGITQAVARLLVEVAGPGLADGPGRDAPPGDVLPDAVGQLGRPAFVPPSVHFPKLMWIVPFLFGGTVLFLVVRGLLGVGRTIADVGDVLGGGGGGRWSGGSPVWVQSNPSRAGDAFGSTPASLPPTLADLPVVGVPGIPGVSGVPGTPGGAAGGF